MHALSNLCRMSGHRFGVVLLLLFAGVAGAADLQAPGISIAGLGSPTLSDAGIQLVCNVRVQNPNATALPLTDAVVNLKLADTPAAVGRLLKPVTVPGRSVRDVAVLVDVAASAAATWLPLYFSSAQFSLPFDVRGHVDVAHAAIGRVPFHETGQVAMTGTGIDIRSASPQP